MDMEQIRSAIKALPRASNGKIIGVPVMLRAEILREASNFEQGGAIFASSIGLSYATIAGWGKSSSGSRAKRSAFRRIEVKAETVLGKFLVEGPGGLRVPGLNLNEIAFLFREVNREL